MSVADTIAEQIGKEALFMIGTKLLVSNKNSLIIHLKRGPHKMTHIRVTLNSRDLYDIEFFIFTKKAMNFDPVVTIEDCYAEQLSQIIGNQLRMAVVMPKIDF